MPIIKTHELKQGVFVPEAYQVYNSLDCALTLEIHEELSSLHGNGANAPHSVTYGFERALQAPYLEIMLRGIKIDQWARKTAIESLEKRLVALGHETSNPFGLLQRYAHAIWGKPLNPRSQPQLQEFFYKKMRLPEQWTSKKGVRKLSMDRETLEKLEIHFYARPVVAAILAIRDLEKQKQVFETEIDADGRWRTSYNIAGTETGRPSSSKSSTGTGSNTQNIDPALRYPFISDPGWKLCSIDASQSEARDVGFLHGTLFNDWTFLDNCESGDLHTANARRIWPELPWNGDLKKDLAIAERDFYYGFSYRDMSKRGGHLTNYFGTPWTAARSLKVDLKIMEAFREKYLLAFPAFPRWWSWVSQQLQLYQELTTPFGRRRHFFGRPKDETTLREAIAFDPQSMTAERVNLGMWRVWKYMPEVQLLGNGFDSIKFQYPEELEETVVPKALALMETTLFAPSGRRFSVPMEAELGWNWGKHHREDRPTGEENRYNPNGLKKWKGSKDPRKRFGSVEQ